MSHATQEDSDEEDNDEKDSDEEEKSDSDTSHAQAPGTMGGPSPSPIGSNTLTHHAGCTAIPLSAQVSTLVSPALNLARPSGPGPSGMPCSVSPRPSLLQYTTVLPSPQPLLALASPQSSAVGRSPRAASWYAAESSPVMHPMLTIEDAEFLSCFAEKSLEQRVSRPRRHSSPRLRLSLRGCWAMYAHTLSRPNVIGVSGYQYSVSN